MDTDQFYIQGRKDFPVTGRSILIFSLLVLCLCACEGEAEREKGNGIIVSENRSVRSFNAIASNGNFEIILQEASQPGVQVIGDENLMPFIDIDVDDRTLTLNSSRPITSDEGIKIYVSYKNLNRIDIGGANKVTAENPVRERSLDIEISGASMVDLNLDVRNLDMNLSGAGFVTLSGRARNQNIEMSGVGNLEASELISERCRIAISGLGGAEVHVTESLEADVSGVGGVEYAGNPAEVQSNVSGLGKVHAAGRE